MKAKIINPELVGGPRDYNTKIVAIINDTIYLEVIDKEEVPKDINGCKWCGGELVVGGQTECDSCHELASRLRCGDPKLVVKIVVGVLEEKSK